MAYFFFNFYSACGKITLGMDINLIINFLTMNEFDPTRPTLEKVLVGNIALIILFIVIVIAVEVGKYAIGTKIYGKKKAFKAIIPVYGLMLLFRSVDLNPWLAISAYIPIIGIIPFCIFSFFVPKAFGAKKELQILAIFAPFVVFNMLGFDKQYEFQYVKGKNVAFKDEFRTVMPEDLASDVLTPANAVNGAAVSSMVAKESMVSRAASAAAEQTRIIREEQERQAAEEAKKKAEEEAAKKAAKQKPEDYNYDIFNSENKDNGPESASLNIDFKTINGRFQSAPVAKQAALAQNPAPVQTPNPIAQPAPTPAPVSAPVQTVAPVQAPKPVLAQNPAQAPKPTPTQNPTPAPQPTSIPKPVAPQPTAPAPASPGIQMTSIPPSQ